MAYVSQEDKKKLAVGIKKVLKKYNVKGTIGVHHHSTIVVRLRSGDLDILGNYWEVYTQSVERGQIEPWNQRKEKPTYLDVNRIVLIVLIQVKFLISSTNLLRK